MQGTPTIARTGSRWWVAWRADSHVAAEASGNYIVLACSDDELESFAEYSIYTYPGSDEYQIVDPMLWEDPDGTLWLLVGVGRARGAGACLDGLLSAWAAVCSTPSAATPLWSDSFLLSPWGDPRHPVKIGCDWYLMIDLWRERAAGPPADPETAGPHLHRFDWRRKRLEHVSRLPPNNGAGYAGFFETEIVGLRDGCILATGRYHGRVTSDPATWTRYSISQDGTHWPPWASWEALGISSASRMWVGRTPAGGRLLDVYNNDGVRRSLTVALSDDDGRSFPHKAVIEPDNPHQLTYPVVAFGPDDHIAVAYDVSRTHVGAIKVARLRERDIVAGRAVPQVRTVSIIP